MEFKFKPNQGDYPVFYKGYVDTLDDLPLIETLEMERDFALKVFDQIPVDKADYQYAPSKWTIKQVLLHIIDTEVVFGYRGLAIARGDKAQLPGFDQDEYMSGVSVEETSLGSLVECFRNLRNSNIALFRMLRDSDLDNIGTASGYSVSSRTLGYFIAGHCRYHAIILVERYGI